MVGTVAPLLLGLGLLVAGGELLVRSGVALARDLNVSPLLVGLTMVGFGTSTPELVTSVQAGWAGSPGIALGNVVGSNIANILLILGLAAVVRPLQITAGAFRRDGTVLAGVTVLLIGAAFSLGLGKVTGILFLLLLVGYTAWVYRSERAHPGPAANVFVAEGEGRPLWRLGRVASVLVLLAALAALIAGADLFVDGARSLAATAGLSETLIGLTLVAVGTSLPELTTSVLAAARGHSDVAFGNIVGSNIFNVLGILGIAGLVAPLAFPEVLFSRDLWVLAGATGLLLVFAWTAWRLTRWEGIAFLVAYGGYLLWGFSS